MKPSKIILSAITIVTVVILAIIVFSLLQSSKSRSVQSTDILNKEEVGNTSKAQNQINHQASLSTNPPTESPKRVVQTDSNPEEEAEEIKVDPVVMTDYKNWTVIANEIEQNDNQSIATGDIGVAHRDGFLAVANEGIITHTNQSGSIDSIYLPGESSIELPDGTTMSATETELIQKPDGSHTMHVKKAELHGSFASGKMYINGKEINPQEYFANQQVEPTVKTPAE